MIRRDGVRFAAVLLVAASSSQVFAAGWRTAVEDHAGGVRVAALIGTAGSSERPGIVAVCSADGDFPATISVAMDVALPLDLRPGAPAILSIGHVDMKATVARNESGGALIESQTDSLARVLDELESTTGQATIGVSAGGVDQGFTIPADGMKLAIEDIRLVCGL